VTQLMKVVDNGTAVAVRPQPASNPNGGGGLLALTPERWQMYKEIAKHAFESGLFGNVKNINAAITVMLQGVELGLQPMAAINNIYIVNGRPSLKAQLMAAIIVKAGHPPVKTIKSDNKECTVRFQRAGNDPVDVTFTMEQATKAKLAGKDVWQSYPEDMLWNRAVARGARRVFPELFAGLYTVDEMQDLATTQALEEPGTVTVEAEPVTTQPAQFQPSKMTPDEFKYELAQIDLRPSHVAQYFNVNSVNELVKGEYKDEPDPLKKILEMFVRGYKYKVEGWPYIWDHHNNVIVKLPEPVAEPEQPVQNCPECDGPVEPNVDGVLTCTAKGCGWFKFVEEEA
jgi:hypothetical protein